MRIDDNKENNHHKIDVASRRFVYIRIRATFSKNPFPDIRGNNTTVLKKKGNNKGCITHTAWKLVIMEKQDRPIISALPGNDKCIDCGESYPLWASVKFGTLFCLD